MTLEGLLDERSRACRLLPDRALASLDEAVAFVADRGLLTRTADGALPSLFGAAHEPPAQPGRGGFGEWPASKWIWSFQLGGRGGTLLTKLHRGKTLYLSPAAAEIFAPLCRQAAEAATGDDELLLRHLARAGPSLPADLQFELGWERARLKRSRDRLERSGAVVSDGLVFGATIDDWHYAPLRLWSEAVPHAPRLADPHGEVVVAGVRAAVLAPEAEVRRWFSWPLPAGTVDELVGRGRLRRPAPGWLALP